MMPRILFLTVYTKIIVECPLAATQFLDQRYVNPKNMPYLFFHFLCLILMIAALVSFLPLTVHIQFYHSYDSECKNKTKLKYMMGSTDPVTLVYTVI